MLSERLRGFQLPPVTEVPRDAFLVARLRAVDLDGIFNSPEYEFDNALDARFGKIMVRTTSLLLGGDACGRYGYCELTEMSLLLDAVAVTDGYQDATDLQNYLVGLASTRLSRLIDAEAVFTCQMFAFGSDELVQAYFTWRQQETYLAALDSYCSMVLLRDGGSSQEQVRSLLSGLGPGEKEEILQQNELDYSKVPAWQRFGVGVHLQDGRVTVQTSLPRDEDYRGYLQQFMQPLAHGAQAAAADK